MPQLDPEYYLSQVFWLAITFIFLLLFLWRVSLPRIKRVLEKRSDKINKDLEDAKNLQEKAENFQKKIDTDLNKAEIDTQNLIALSVNNFKKESAEKIDSIKSELEVKIHDAELKIQQTKKSALKNIKKDVELLTSLVIEKLTSKRLDKKYLKKQIDKIDVN